MELLGILLGRSAYFFTPFFLIPFCYGLIMDEIGTWIFLVALFISLAIAMALFRPGKNKRTIRELPVREGALFLFTAWFFLALLGMLPFIGYSLMGAIQLDLPTFFLESMSAVTTTGMTNTERDLPILLRLWCSVMSLGGGVFFVIMIMTVLPVVSGHYGITISKRYAMSISPVWNRIVEPIKKILVFFAVVVIMWIFMFIHLEIEPLEAIMLTFYSVTTGGGPVYGTLPADMGVIIAISILSVLSSLSILLWWQAVRERSLQTILKDSELHGYLKIIFIAGVILSLYLAVQDIPLVEAGGKGFFYAISFLSTNSFLLADFEHISKIPDFWRLFCTLLSMIGGMVATTAGGFGILRLLIIIALIKAELRRTLHPRMVVVVRIGQAIIPSGTASRVVYLFFIYALLILLSSIILSLANISPSEALALSVGSIFSAGGVPALFSLTNLAILPAWAKIFCSLLMVIGRIEVIALLILITSQWEKKSSHW